MKIAIIGGGASGFFLAIHVKQSAPSSQVVILEKSSRPLIKVGLSGGGRCNLTNTFEHIDDISQAYPRGARLMKRLLREFSPAETCRWFEEHGVPLVAQDDDCVFPVVQDSAAVVGCLTRVACGLGVEVRLRQPVRAVTRDPSGMLQVYVGDEERGYDLFDKVAVTTGGAPRGEGHAWLAALGQEIEPPCPSLYTFAITHKALNDLMGLVVEHTVLSLPGTKFRSRGPLLVTHWGISGPAVLKLSSYAARHLCRNGYRSPLLVCWIGDTDTERVRKQLTELFARSPHKQIGSLRPFGLQQRLWGYLVERCGLSVTQSCGEPGGKSLNRLAALLTADAYQIEGKGHFRDEFVTCGGVSLTSVNVRTLESKNCPGLYFAGEVLDIDGITGGFNLQAAWSTAFVAARAISRQMLSREQS